MRRRDEPRRAFPGESLVLQVSIDDLPHPVTRELHVDSGVSLDLLHEILQITLGWTNSHLYSFEVGDVVFSAGEAEDLLHVDAGAAPLGAVAMTHRSFGYLYDFGDDWNHTIHVSDVVELDDGVIFRCVAGVNAAPPEDCGGAPGFAQLLEVLADPSHPERRETKTWVGRKYDPKRFDLAAIEKELGKLRREVIRATKAPRRR